MAGLREYIAEKFKTAENIRKNQETYSRIRENLELSSSLSDLELQIHNSNERSAAVSVPDRSEDEVFHKLWEADFHTSRANVHAVYKAPKGLLKKKIHGLMQKIRDRKMKAKEYWHIKENSIKDLCTEWAAEIREEYNLSPKGYSSITVEKRLEAARRRDRAIEKATRFDPEKLRKPLRLAR